MSSRRSVIHRRSTESSTSRGGRGGRNFSTLDCHEAIASALNPLPIRSDEVWGERLGEGLPLVTEMELDLAVSHVLYDAVRNSR